VSSIVIKDIAGPTTLERTAMTGILGGMEVRIESVSSSIQKTDDASTISPGLFGKLVDVVLNELNELEARRRRPR